MQPATHKSPLVHIHALIHIHTLTSSDTSCTAVLASDVRLVAIADALATSSIATLALPVLAVLALRGFVIFRTDLRTLRNMALQILAVSDATSLAWDANMGSCTSWDGRGREDANKQDVACQTPIQDYRTWLS
jgi:hypothetical protein